MKKIAKLYWHFVLDLIVSPDAGNQEANIRFIYKKHFYNQEIIY